MFQANRPERKLSWKVGSWFIFDYELHEFLYHYILLFYNKKNGQIVKILILRYYYIYFFRSGKLVPGLVKTVSLPDRMSCKVLRTFVKTVIYMDA